MFFCTLLKTDLVGFFSFFLSKQDHKKLWIVVFSWKTHINKKVTDDSFIIFYCSRRTVIFFNEQGRDSNNTGHCYDSVAGWFDIWFASFLHAVLCVAFEIIIFSKRKTKGCLFAANSKAGLYFCKTLEPD